MRARIDGWDSKWMIKATERWEKGHQIGSFVPPTIGQFVNFLPFLFPSLHRLIDGQLRILNASVYTSRILKHAMNSDSDSRGSSSLSNVPICIYHRQEIYICDLWASMVRCCKNMNSTASLSSERNVNVSNCIWFISSAKTRTRV